MQAEPHRPGRPNEPAAAAAVEAAETPSGPTVAVLIAAGIGALVLAILTVWAEASEAFKDSLAYSDRVGPLSGKTIWATVAFLVSWGALHVALRGRRVNLAKATGLALVVFGLAYLGTFAPFFELFAPD